MIGPPKENKLKIGFETGSNLSLSIRLTRAKRLRRKRCCDTTPGSCQEGSRLTILFRISLNASSSSKSRVGIPEPEAHHEKNARRLCQNLLPNEDFRLKRLYQPKKSSLFFKCNLQTSFVNLLSSIV